MNKVISISKLTKSREVSAFKSGTSVVVDKKGVPIGFVFGRESFITMLSKIDEEFEKKVKDPKKAYDNIAGKLIDLIEEKLPVNPAFIEKIRTSIKETQKNGWISLKEINKALHV